MPENHQRKNIRKENHDYSKPGGYFITICTHNDSYLFGNIIDGKMILNDPGKMIKKHWNELPNRFQNIIVDEYMVMPNHFHGILNITPSNANAIGIGDIVGAFKSLTTNEYITNVKSKGWRPFTKKLWHWNYFDHIIRNEDEYNEITKYIHKNPQNWQLDINNNSSKENLLRESHEIFAKKIWMV